EPFPDSVKAFGRPGREPTAAIGTAIAEAAFQPRPGVRLGIAQLVDSEPGQVGAAQMLEAVKRSERDIRLVVLENDRVFHLAVLKRDLLDVENLEERPLGGVPQHRKGRRTDQTHQTGVQIGLEEGLIGEGIGLAGPDRPGKAFIPSVHAMKLGGAGKWFSMPVYPGSPSTISSDRGGPRTRGSSPLFLGRQEVLQ